jgi:hypothetical protein
MLPDTRACPDMTERSFIFFLSRAFSVCQAVPFPGAEGSHGTPETFGYKRFSLDNQKAKVKNMIERSFILQTGPERIGYDRRRT